MVLALALLILWPIAELLVAIQVAHAIGALATVVLLIATWPLGTWALRTHGAAAWRRFVDAVAAGRPPAREAVDGALVLIGGVLLIVPGFITDAIGAFLVLAPTRALLRPLLLRNARRRTFVRAAGFARGRSYDVDSTATDIDQPQLRS
jgi:UPF0716 protein FxsA